MPGALIFILSRRYNNIQVASDTQFRNPTTYDSTCVIRNTLPQVLKIENGRPVLSDDDEAFTIVLKAEELLVN